MKIIKKELIYLGCPTSYYVYLDNGYLLRATYRWGRLVIAQSRRKTVNRWDAVAGEEIYNEKIGGFYDSFMSWDELKPKIIEIL